MMKHTDTKEWPTHEFKETAEWPTQVISLNTEHDTRVTQVDLNTKEPQRKSAMQETLTDSPYDWKTNQTEE